MDNNNPTYTDHPHPYNNNNNISISSMEEDELLLLHEPSFDHHHPWPCTLPPPPGSNEIFGSHPAVAALEEEEEEEELGAMKEMMFKMAAMQPVDIDPATIRRPRRRNVRISEDPQSVAARLRRERISEKMRILQRLVPGGTKMDTASMLDEAIRYVKFLKRQLRILQHPTIHHHHHHHPISSFNRTY